MSLTREILTPEILSTQMIEAQQRVDSYVDYLKQIGKWESLYKARGDLNAYMYRGEFSFKDLDGMDDTRYFLVSLNKKFPGFFLVDSDLSDSGIDGLNQWEWKGWFSGNDDRMEPSMPTHGESHYFNNGAVDLMAGCFDYQTTYIDCRHPHGVECIKAITAVIRGEQTPGKDFTLRMFEHSQFGDQLVVNYLGQMTQGDDFSI